MNKLNSALVVAVIGCVTAPALGAGQNPPSGPVTVVNTATNPVPITAPQGLPVSGSVTVTGGPVSASQSGTWNVGITGTPTVAISGPVTTVPAGDPADTAVQFLLFPTPDDCGSADSDNYYSVPAGNRLVIEFVSASAVSQVDHADASFALRINTTLGASPHFQILPMPRQVVDNGGNPFATFANAVPMRAYADADTRVCVTREYLFGGPIGDIRVEISGHLVPQP